jgi:hypothetical protein
MCIPITVDRVLLGFNISLRRGLNDISCTKFHAAFVLGFISTWILSGILSAGSHLCSEIPRKKNTVATIMTNYSVLVSWLYCFVAKLGL